MPIDLKPTPETHGAVHGQARDEALPGLIDDKVIAAIAEAIAAVGTADFPRAIAALCLKASHFDSAFICAFFTGDKPLPLYSDLSDEQDRRIIVPYVGSAYLLDPFYDLFKQNVGDRVVGLNECSPDDFRSSDYYRMFYADTDLNDEMGVFVRLGTDASILMSLGVRDDRLDLSQRSKSTLEALLGVIANLCRQHWPRLAPSPQAGSSRRDNHLEKAFEMFATSMLSNRESEIVRLILKGHSSKSMARVLGNSPETVKVHRKRIYAKMGITSQGELFSIFLRALSCMPPEGQDDPLSYLEDFAPAPR
ncbi:helix-turn-helix transcriptional regulator [Aminobacter sp. BA135]|uniref:helix-turn-helix transcriptional regulator n=1 Tax=Aminobacter sp. BA135 TaxID=537596 RepID=UPI003D7A3DDE